MFCNEPKILIAVYNDELALNQIKKLVESNDDGEDSVTGTKDRSVNIVSWSEKVWLDQKKAGNINDKVLFLGKIKGSEKLIPVVDIKFDMHGVKYGWAGNQAIIWTDVDILKEKEAYYNFLNELKELPIPDVLKTQSKKHSIITHVSPNQSGLSGVISGLASLGIDFGLQIKDAVADKQTKRKQMLFFGIIKLYCNHLEEFMCS